jgi:hypothetical protein
MKTKLREVMTGVCITIGIVVVWWLAGLVIDKVISLFN